ncbi:hypothetical protein NPIL_404521 [Nephila pilipes]|uniref:Uncharacterized protein n=1 Tax=Nephila pilipes TaxID=299642 RepID=A0A8X6UV19_NEPPI|nr:hypothetical protein NPIL_404521 [Nephila pilipes]
MRPLPEFALLTSSLFMERLIIGGRLVLSCAGHIRKGRFGAPEDNGVKNCGKKAALFEVPLSGISVVIAEFEKLVCLSGESTGVRSKMNQVGSGNRKRVV